MPTRIRPRQDFQYSLSNLKPLEPVQKIALTFPDGAGANSPKTFTGLDIRQGHLAFARQAHGGDGA